MLLLDFSASSSQRLSLEESIQFSKAEDLTKLNEIISELVDLTNHEASSTTTTATPNTSHVAAELRREQSQINWFLSQHEDLNAVENFDIDFENVLIFENNPMISEVELF